MPAVTDQHHDSGGAADTIDLQQVDRIVAEYGAEPESLTPILNAIQHRFNYLPEPALRHLAETTEISAAAIMGVATFYSRFRMRPAGRHTIRVCIGTACHVKGAEDVYNAFRLHLDIGEGEDTDKQRSFTVEKVACLGCCMLAPAVQIDDVTYGFVSPGRVEPVLTDFLAAQKESQEADDVVADRRTISGEVRFCLCSSCVAGGTEAVQREARRQVKELELDAAVRTVGCSGQSYQTPIMEVAMQDGRVFRYGMVQPDNVRTILLRHFRPSGLGGRLKARVESALERILTDEAWVPVTRYEIDSRSGPDACYLQSQQHLVTEHAGSIDPLDIDAYVHSGGYRALREAVAAQDSETIIREIDASGLRGRGGAGYRTAAKWRHVRDAEGTPKYIICNGDEGDPGAFMDRMILESFPFRVLEGMTCAARAVGAEEGYFYIRAEYPLAAGRVRKAIQLAERRGYLGQNILGSDWSLTLHVVEGAGAFVCGEESALIAALEGKRGMPHYRPPYPAQRGLHDKPTLVNNVETFGLVPWILCNGAKAFAALGSRNSSGTKAFALAGKIKHGGLIEVPMGITLRRIVEDIGGGMIDGLKLKAVQVGGPSGGCVPADLCETPVDYEALGEIGAMMGSGGMVVLADNDCMVDIARYFLSFTQHESCGKCTYCRIGTKRMLEILERLCRGEGKDEDIAELQHLAEVTQEGSLCGLGRTAPNPVLSTLHYFRSEYEAHLQGKCPAGKCKDLIHYRITDQCIGCTRCSQRCPADAIPMQPYEQHEIDQEKCTRCDTCRQTCPVDAVVIE